MRFELGEALWRSELLVSDGGVSVDACLQSRIFAVCAVCE